MADETRERILTGAEELLRNGSLHDMSMERVATWIGVSRKSIYNHFSGKADLVAEAVTAALQRVVGRLAAIAADRSLDYVEKLDRIVEIGFREMHRLLTPAPAMDRPVVPLEIRQAVRELNSHIRSLIEEVVAEGASRGLFADEVEPKLFSRVLLNVVNGIRVMDDRDALTVSPIALLRESLRICLVGALSDDGRVTLSGSRILAVGTVQP